MGQEEVQLDPVRLAQRIERAKYPNLENLKNFAAKEEYVIMRTLKQRHTEVDLCDRAAEIIDKNSKFGDELIDIEHYYIDFRLLILSLKLDYMRKLTTSKYKEFNEYDVSAMFENLNAYNSGKIEEMRIFRAIIDDQFKFSKKSFKIQFALFMIFYAIPMIFIIKGFYPKIFMHVVFVFQVILEINELMQL